jgi:ubiquinone/menaquinone biosynthesis C-methylase UbiE
MYKTKGENMENRVCPWYIGYLLANPLRAIYQNPSSILGPYLKPGMKVLEVGPGMGFFTLPMAAIVGDTGKIYSVDLQDKMLSSLRRRARRRKLDHIIDTRLCSGSSLGVESLKETMDFVLAFAVVHEIPETERFLDEVRDSLRTGGTMLVSEPKGHVKEDEFESLIISVEKHGFKILERPNIRGGHSAVFAKK